VIHPSDETIDFRPAQAAIEQLLALLPDLPGLTDLHVQSGIATVRARGTQCARIGITPAAGLDQAVHNIAALTASALGREISVRAPILEQRIPPRYRVSVSHPSITQDGRWALALRLLAVETIPLWQWVADGYLTERDQERLVALMESPKTVLVAGSMGAGKTQLLRAMIDVMPSDQRLLVIEDASELNVTRPNTVAWMTSSAADLSALIAHSFRFDGQRVIVGEIRDHAAMAFLTLASGGTRALTTIHCEAGLSALSRLHQLVLQSRFVVSMDEIRKAVHAVVTVERFPDEARRVSIWES
jgi:Flp pilus assembly CpaF family ATPase